MTDYEIASLKLLVGILQATTVSSAQLSTLLGRLPPLGQPIEMMEMTREIVKKASDNIDRQMTLIENVNKLLEKENPAE